MIVPIEANNTSDDTVFVNDVEITYEQSADCVSHPDAAQFF